MTAKHSRAAHRRGKRRRQGQNFLLALLGVGLLILVTIFVLASGILSFNPKANNSSTTSTQQSTTSTNQSQSAEETDEPNQIMWEKQAEPVQIPILMYHAIHDMAPGEEANANLIVSPATFQSHLQALQDAGYYTLSPEEAYKALTENVLPQGKKVVWLTFDDSIWDFYDLAYPLLKQYNMQATNNVITGVVGNEGSLTLEEMEEMKNSGMSFQGHTVTHPDLEYSTIEAQTAELTEAKSYLDNNLQQNTIAIAYPSGRYSSDTLAIAEQAKYKLGLTTNEGLASAADGLLSLNRVRILPTTTADILLQTIATP